MPRNIFKFVYKFLKLPNLKLSCKVKGKRLNRGTGYDLEIFVKFSLGSALESLAIESSLWSSLGSSQESSVIASSLGSSVIVFDIPCAISFINNLKGFAIIFCFKISIATDALILSLQYLMQLPEIWTSFWKEKKSFILDFCLGSEYTYAESFISRRIHAEVFRKIAFLKGFSKFLEKFLWQSTFQRSYKQNKTPTWVLPCEAAFLCFLKSYIKDCLEFFNTPVNPHSNYKFTPT